VGGHPLRPPSHRSLGRPLPYQLANDTRGHPKAADYSAFSRRQLSPWAYPVLAQISLCYPNLQGRFLTRYSPVRQFTIARKRILLDLHVLSTPPAFVLSQDQTLHPNSLYIPFLGPAYSIVKHQNLSFHPLRRKNFISNTDYSVNRFFKLFSAAFVTRIQLSNT
jgi:hypothetical protein